MNRSMRLQRILDSSSVGRVLPAISQLNLPDWWLAGGAVRNTVWRSLFGSQCGLVINDFDIAFFDWTGDRTQEQMAKEALTAQFPDYKFDVKNQASFARWRSGRQLYTSAEEGIANWLHTATAVGVRLSEAEQRQAEQWQLFAPYGLDDLFEGIIRTTPAHRHNPDAERKAHSFLEKCPCLRLLHY